MKLRTLFFALLTLTLTVNAIAQKKVTLKFQPKEGTEVNYAFSMNIETVAMGMTMPMIMGMEMDTKIGGKDGDLIPMETKISAIKMDMDMMGQKVAYDSKMPDSTDAASAQFAAIFGNMIGQGFTSFMKPNGKVDRIEGMENMLPPGSGINPSQTAQQSFAFFPDSPVAVGESWQSLDTVANNGVTMALDNVWTLEKVEGKYAYLKVETNFSPVAGAASPVQIKGMEGLQTGTIQVDIASGITLNSNLTQDLTMSMDAGGQAAEVTVKSKINVVGTKK